MKQILLFILLLSAAGCNAQEFKKEVYTTNIQAIQPAENRRVYKQYDEAGNLIGYGSTYTWSYSSSSHIPSSIDSALVSFTKRLQSRLAPMFAPGVAVPPNTDKSMQASLQKRWEDNEVRTQQMLQRADSFNRSVIEKYYKTSHQELYNTKERQRHIM